MVGEKTLGEDLNDDSYTLHYYQSPCPLTGDDLTLSLYRVQSVNRLELVVVPARYVKSEKFTGFQDSAPVTIYRKGHNEDKRYTPST